MPSKPSSITMDAVYAAPGYLFRRMQQIAVSIFVEECRAFDLTPVQYEALVERKPSRGDKRVKLLHLTRSGSAVLRDVMPLVDHAQMRMLQPLKAADRKTLLALMTQLVDL